MSAGSSKPGQHHSVLDWLSNNQQLAATAQSQRLASAAIRQEGRALRSQTHCRTAWDESDTSRRLSDRAWDVARWKEALERCAQEVDEEMEALALATEQAEQALAATAAPLEVSRECLTLRDGRRGAELVMDPVDEELRKEAELAGRAQQVLQQHISSSFEQSCVLQEALHRLTADIRDKVEALEVDLACLSLTTDSPLISLKTQPAGSPAGTSTPEQWLHLSQANVAAAQEAVQASRRRREAMGVSRAQLRNELEAQRGATEFALRKRLHQEEEAHSQLEWQLRKTEEEMAQMEADVHELQAEVEARTASLKLAHTRLEWRSSRAGLDRCRDQATAALLHQVAQLENSRVLLGHKLTEAGRSLQQMKLLRCRLLQDLSRKQEALSLERRSMSRLRSARPPHAGSGLLVPLSGAGARTPPQPLAHV